MFNDYTVHYDASLRMMEDGHERVCVCQPQWAELLACLEVFPGRATANADKIGCFLMPVLKPACERQIKRHNVVPICAVCLDPGNTIVLIA